MACDQADGRKARQSNNSRTICHKQRDESWQDPRQRQCMLWRGAAASSRQVGGEPLALVGSSSSSGAQAETCKVRQQHPGSPCGLFSVSQRYVSACAHTASPNGAFAQPMCHVRMVAKRWHGCLMFDCSYRIIPKHQLQLQHKATGTAHSVHASIRTSGSTFGVGFLGCGGSGSMEGRWSWGHAVETPHQLSCEVLSRYCYHVNLV